ncbi:MAG TPA: DUF2254 domain-containing protein [Afifellaceae bacterium]|nr:DUF2254 domain-containing protein [Afifellaceae bacterium]
MSNRLQILWEKLRTSIWPLPVLMLGVGVLLRELAFLADAALGDSTTLQIWWLHSGTGDDARNLLSTLVSALITMASVMFSITMVVLSLAANQFGSRLVRTYMADLRTQLALGTFVMAVVYCLLVLRTVSNDMPADEVPHVAVTVGLGLSLICILALLFFLHVIARSMVADDVIRRVAEELENSVEALPPIETSFGRPVQTQARGPAAAEGRILASRDEGYVQAIDYDGLAAVAKRHGITINLLCSAGAFMCKEGWLANIHPATALTSQLASAIQDEIRIGARRTPTQDLEFSIRHLVDVALRALSPGINDPHTATVVIDRLRGALSRLMTKRIPSTILQDETGIVRVVGHQTGYAAILNEALNQIRQAGAVHPAIVIHLLGAIERIAEHVRLPEQRDALLQHVELIADDGLRATVSPRDRADIEEKRDVARRTLRNALKTELSAVPVAPRNAVLTAPAPGR